MYNIMYNVYIMYLNRSKLKQNWYASINCFKTFHKNSCRLDKNLQ